MSALSLFLLTGAGLFCIGLVALVRQEHLIRKILALNVSSSGVFLVLIAFARRSPEGGPDPVPQAMVLTGIVVSVGATAVGLALARKYSRETGSTSLPVNEFER